jgi:Mn2+/Fe2+ NRAMP family transporter
MTIYCYGEARWNTVAGISLTFYLLFKIPRTLACVITKYLCIYLCEFGFKFDELRCSLMT